MNTFNHKLTCSWGKPVIPDIIDVTNVHIPPTNPPNTVPSPCPIPEPADESTLPIYINIRFFIFFLYFIFFQKTEYFLFFLNLFIINENYCLEYKWYKV